jgi:hypothetical protein
MDYKILEEKEFKNIEGLTRGYVLKIAIVATDTGRMLKLSFDGFGSEKVSFFTDSKWLVVHRYICSNSLSNFQRELTRYFGYDCDLSALHHRDIFADYALFDVEKIWDYFGYLPTNKMNLHQFRKYIMDV